MLCAICHIRKPKRDCPGVRAAICTTCCGTGREQTIDCPLSCEYLRDAHLHEQRVEVDAASIPNMDIEVDDAFLEANEFLILLLTIPIARLVKSEPAITDHDMREALEAMVKSARTLQSGIVYEHLPTNPYAASVCETLRDEIEKLRARAAAADPDAAVTDKQLLGIFVFLQRLEYTWNNGRRKSRAFIDIITRPFDSSALEEEDSLEPDEPRIIL